jgi:hypothetical protein
MGLIAILIAPVTWFFVYVVYGLPFPQSISETATIGGRTDSLLPLGLGALALFSVSYALVYAHDRLDKLLPLGMFFGFILVAVQPCASPYIISERVGIFGIPMFWSNAVHCAGAFAGFGSMLLWVLLCFTKSNVDKEKQTREKHIRDNWYFALSLLMMFSLVLFVFDKFGAFTEGFPTTFWAEAFMLTFGGLACLIKGGQFLGDR